MVDYFIKENEIEKQALLEDGVEFIKLNAEDKEYFQEIVQQEKWKAIEKNAPNQINKLQDLLNYTP